MANLLSHLTEDEKNWLKNKINHPGEYDMPSLEEVLEYLESTSDSEPSEEVMGDLIVQYLEDEGIMFDFC